MKAAPAPTRPAAPPTIAIDIDGVSKTYGDGRSSVVALDHLSLEVATGEFACLVGASGCGKSTLLNLIAGIYHLDEGVIATGAHRIGLMFQEPALFPWLTVAQNVEAAMRFRGVPRERRRARTAELLDLVSLGPCATWRPHQLSGGMQQRVALARALAQDADILLMDEPFGSLDAMTRDVLHDELERIWQTSALTVVFVTHNVREAVRLGDRVVLLSSRPGRVVAQFPVGLPRPRRIDGGPVSTLAATVTDALRREVRRHGH
jgi:NitT/TauT family transport system ATP-binding protein